MYQYDEYEDNGIMSCGDETRKEYTNRLQQEEYLRRMEENTSRFADAMSRTAEATERTAWELGQYREEQTWRFFCS